MRGFNFCVEGFARRICNRRTRGLVVPGEAAENSAAQGEGAMSDAWAGPETMVFVFLAVGAVALFSMISVAVWSGARRQEREAYYKADMMKKVAEAQGPGANSALEMMREEARIATVRMKQGLQIGGLITGAVGLGVLIFLRFLLGADQGVYLCGLIPLFVGMALFASSYLVKTSA
jgi:hypothetical protein